MFVSLLVIEKFNSVGAFSKLSNRIGSAMTSCNSFFNQLALISTSYNTVPDDRYAVSNGSGYAVLISWDGYAVLDRKLDTPYPMDVNTPVWKSVEYGVSKELDTVIGDFLDSARIRRRYAVSSLMDTAYWSSE
ncbi:hypothetical protein Tco_0874834 [Tanacetum coccineum]|uniref:Uncharacterized protein n=1 Tax=Tanacetum coccineum TaxID=301880 RepID=A0ABQ5BRE7_9ASTR